MLWSIVYVSSSVTQSIEKTGPEILASARRNNAERGVTGVLAFAAGSFLQALEGEQADVRSTFERIKRDPRHTTVIPLIDEAIEERAFAGWEMAWLDLPKDHPMSAEVASSLKDVRLTRPNAASSATVRILLDSFSESMLR